MIIVRRDAQDRIEAVIHFMLVDKTGKLEPCGKYVFVEQIEINPGLSRKRIIKGFILEIAQTYPWTQFAYWGRFKKRRSKLRTYTRDQLLRRWSNEVPVMVTG